MFKESVNGRFLLISLLLLVILGCDDEEQKSDITASVATFGGDSLYLQMSYQSDTRNGFVVARTVGADTRQYIYGGDMIVAQHAGQQILLYGDNKRLGIYGAEMPYMNVSNPVVFTIKYMPVESRKKRWYPSDLAYVDRGAGRYVNGFNFSDNFLQLSVDLVSPAQGTFFYNKGDRVLIQWNAHGTQSALVNTSRLMAFHHCTGDSVELYKTSGADKLSGSRSITIDDMFEEGSTSSYAKLARTLTHYVQGSPISVPPQASSSLLSRAKTRINNCDITIYVIAEKQTSIGAPFSSGHVSSSIYQLRTIHFRNRNTGRSIHYYGVSSL